MFKKKDKKVKKLNLSAATIRNLSNVELKEVIGGETGPCSDTGPEGNCKPF